MDLESFLSRAVSIAKSPAGDETKTRERTSGVLRSLLQILLTPGLNPDIDAICREKLVLPVTQASVGFHGFAHSSRLMDPHSDFRDPETIPTP